MPQGDVPSYPYGEDCGFINKEGGWDFYVRLFSKITTSILECGLKVPHQSRGFFFNRQTFLVMVQGWISR
jgi:hypothetical protein